MVKYWISLIKRFERQTIFYVCLMNLKEDSWPWEEGGLSFKDPLTGDLLGSNDAA